MTPRNADPKGGINFPASVTLVVGVLITFFMAVGFLFGIEVSR